MYTWPTFSFEPAEAMRWFRYCLSPTAPSHLRLTGIRLLTIGAASLGEVFVRAVRLQFRHLGDDEPVFIKTIGSSSHGAYLDFPVVSRLADEWLNRLKIRTALVVFHFGRCGRLDFHVLALNAGNDGEILVRRLRLFRRAMRAEMRALVHGLNCDRLKAGLPSIANFSARYRPYFVDLDPTLKPDRSLTGELPEQTEMAEAFDQREPVPPVPAVDQPSAHPDPTPRQAEQVEHKVDLEPKPNIEATLTPVAPAVPENEVVPAPAPTVVSTITAGPESVPAPNEALARARQLEEQKRVEDEAQRAKAKAQQQRQQAELLRHHQAVARANAAAREAKAAEEKKKQQERDREAIREFERKEREYEQRTLELIRVEEQQRRERADQDRGPDR